MSGANPKTASRSVQQLTDAPRIALQFLLVMIASSINERMQKRLDYKTQEVLVLKEILKAVTGKSRIDFNDSQRKRLAAKGKDLTPKERDECCELVRPRTILEWFRRLYAEKYDSSKSRGRSGRPCKTEETRRLAVAIARDNLSWGTRRSEMPSMSERDKQRTWKQFMSSHWESLYACDFFTVEALGVFGAVRHMVFFVVKLETREVHIAGIRVNPDGAWMKQAPWVRHTHEHRHEAVTHAHDHDSDLHHRHRHEHPKPQLPSD